MGPGPLGVLGCAHRGGAPSSEGHTWVLALGPDMCAPTPPNPLWSGEGMRAGCPDLGVQGGHASHQRVLAGKAGGRVVGGFHDTGMSSLSFGPIRADPYQNVASGRFYRLADGSGRPSKAALPRNVLLEQERTLKRPRPHSQMLRSQGKKSNTCL